MLIDDDDPNARSVGEGADGGEHDQGNEGAAGGDDGSQAASGGASGGESGEGASEGAEQVGLPGRGVVVVEPAGELSDALGDLVEAVVAAGQLQGDVLQIGVARLVGQPVQGCLHHGAEVGVHLVGGG